MTTQNDYPGGCPVEHGDAHTAVLFDYGMGSIVQLPPEVMNCLTCREEYPGTGDVVALLRAAAPIELHLNGSPDADRRAGFGHRGLGAALASVRQVDGSTGGMSVRPAPLLAPAWADDAGTRRGADGASRVVVPLQPRHEGPVRVSGRPPRLGRTWFVAAAAVFAVFCLGAGVLLGQQRFGAPPAPVVSADAGQLLASGVTGDVAASTVLSPKEGWVAVHSTVRGIPAGQRCSIVLVDKAGREYVAASWTTGQPTPAGAQIDGSVVVDGTQLASVVIRNDQGLVFSSLPIA